MEALQRNLKGVAEVAPQDEFDPVPGWTKECKNPDCRSNEIVQDWEAGDLVCAECGWVQLERCMDSGLAGVERVHEDEGVARYSFAASGGLTEGVQALMEKGGAEVVAGVKSGANAYHRNLGRGTRLGRRDQLLLDVKNQVEALCRRLPVELYDNLKVMAIELVVLMWEASGRKMRRTDPVAAAAIWLVCYATHQPLTDTDFLRALGDACDNPRKDFSKAKKQLQELSAKPEIRQFLERVKGEDKDPLQGYTKLFMRWTDDLFTRGGGDTQGKQAVMRSAHIAARVAQQVVDNRVCNGVGRPVVCAAALYIALHRADSAKEEKEVTYEQLAKVAGIDCPKLQLLCQKLSAVEGQVLGRAQAQLDAGPKG